MGEKAALVLLSWLLMQRGRLTRQRYSCTHTELHVITGALKGSMACPVAGRRRPSVVTGASLGKWSLHFFAAASAFPALYPVEVG